MFIALFTGFVAGAAHVITGPDHLAAVAPVAAHRPQQGLKIGLRWGLGHGLGVVALGLLGIYARRFIDVQALSAWSEFFVGFVLIMVGMWAFRKAARMVVHSHGHRHDDAAAHDHDHSHFHVHASAEDHDAPEAHGHHTHAAFWVGMLHGAAGAGHLFGVLPSLALPTNEAIVYLAAYFVAAVFSMAAFGAGVGILARRQNPLMLRRIMYGTSGLAVALGLMWIGQAWPV